jgi:hypothetical protein
LKESEALIRFYLPLLAALLTLLPACNLVTLPEQPEASATLEEDTSPEQTSIPAPPDSAASAFQCSDPEPAFVTDFEVRQPPALDEPAARLPFRDPMFGRCLIRATDRLQDKDDPSGLKNEYSRVQSFNADESLLLARSTQGGWYLYDAASLQPLGQVPLESDPRWSATDPNLIYYFSETRLMAYDIASGGASTVHEFAGDFPGQSLSAVWMRYEGSPSRDTRFWGLMAEDQNYLTSALLVYDLEEDQVIAALDTRGWPDEAREMDSVTISPLGNYFLVYMDKYCQPGQLGAPADPCGLMVYDRSLQNGRGLLRIIGHSDTALDAQGNEVLVYQDIDADSISMLDLASGAVTPLWPIDFTHTAIGLHISGRAFDRPGWAVISTHDGDAASHTWMDDQVFLIELKPGGRAVRLAHTRSLVDENQEHDYWAEPQASASLDLTRVVFTTNWGRSGTEQVEMVEVLVPPEAFDPPHAAAEGQDSKPGALLPQKASWQIQYSGEMDINQEVDVFNLDLFETPESMIEDLHRRGVLVMCYFSAGSYEDWRPDAGQFPAEVLGNDMEGWPGEKWLDVRRTDLLATIMEARLDLAVQKGCDGVDPDNVNGFENDTGFPLTGGHQLAFNRFLSSAAHQRGLLIGLKNDLNQIPDLVSSFDWILNEECFSFQECHLLQPFQDAGKPVFIIEYDLAPEDFCSQANQMGFNALHKNWELDAYRVDCRQFPGQP